MGINVLNEEQLVIKEKKVFTYIIVLVALLSISLIFNIFFKDKVEKSLIEETLYFIRFFNFILAALAFGGCLFSYNRVKNDTIFIISLMYLGLAVGIMLGQIDYLSFYADKYTLSNYTTISTSILRILILVISVSPFYKVRNYIIKNKLKSIIFVVLYSIIFWILENKLFSSSISEDSMIFFTYNIILIVIYLIVALVLLNIGMKEKEYIFIILSSSIMMLVVKAIYAIYGASVLSFKVKLTSVSITYIFSLIVIVGIFIELYIYIAKTKLLNDNLSVFYNLVDNSKHSYVFICDDQLNVLYANNKIKEDYFGSLEVDRKSIEKLLKEKKELAINEGNIGKSLYEKGKWRDIIRNNTDDEIIDCSIQILDEVNNKEIMAVTYMDVSETINKKLELERLKVYDKEKSDFIANLSHELRTPLNIFCSTIQLLDAVSKDEYMDFKKTYYKYNKSLHVNCKRMLRLINNVIDISKIDTGMMKANFSNYNIVAIIEDVSLSVINYASLKSINIQFDTESEEEIIKCDPSMIERAILNLLSNAIKFSNNNNNIYVDILVNEKWIEIYVRDEGIGIPKEIQERIFKKFVQVDKSFTRSNEGSGIGLSIVKSMIELHNGDVSVESEENIGTIFRILLPNEKLDDSEVKIYDIDNINTELELSDIYEILD